MMIHRRTRSHSPERVYRLEEPQVSWRNVGGQLLTLQDNVDKVRARLHHFHTLIAGHKGQLAGDEDSLSVDQVSRIARQFRSDTRQYTTALEEVLDVLEQGNLALWTALHREESRGQLEVASSDDEPRLKRRVQLSRLVVTHWLHFRQPQAAPARPPSSVDSSSSHSDQGSGTAPERKYKRRPWFKPPKREVPSDWTSEKEDADEESGGLTEDKEGPLGLTDEGRSVPEGRTSSSGDGLGAPSRRRGVGRPSSEDCEVLAAVAHASGDSGDGVVTDAGEDPAGQMASPCKSSVTVYRSVGSASLQSFYSATSADDADCEPETTTPATSTSTDSSNRNGDSSGNGNGNGIPSGKINANDSDAKNGNANRNRPVSVQSTGSQTDESWVARDRVELGYFDKHSPWSAMHELCRQFGLVRLALQQHAERLESQRLSRPHLLSRTHPLRASRLLRAQLQAALRTVASEVHAAQHSLFLRAATLRLFHSYVWPSPPLKPPPQEASPRQLLAAAAAAPPHPLGHVVQRAVDFVRGIASRQ